MTGCGLRDICLLFLCGRVPTYRPVSIDVTFCVMGVGVEINFFFSFFVCKCFCILLKKESLFNYIFNVSHEMNSGLYRNQIVLGIDFSLPFNSHTPHPTPLCILWNKKKRARVNKQSWAPKTLLDSRKDITRKQSYTISPPPSLSLHIFTCNFDY